MAGGLADHPGHPDSSCGCQPPREAALRLPPTPATPSAGVTGRGRVADCGRCAPQGGTVPGGAAQRFHLADFLVFRGRAVSDVPSPLDSHTG
jgi:hypothetical protein